jgi:transposase-like protein
MTGTIRICLEWVLQQLIQAEATAFIGAAPHERTATRVAQRNGRRPRPLSTHAGDVELGIPKLREGLLPVVVGTPPPDRPRCSRW